MNHLEAVELAKARSWTDDVEAINGLLNAAGIMDRSTPIRRKVAKDLVARKFTPDDVATFLVHELRRNRSPRYMSETLLRDPEAVAKRRSMGATPQSVGPVNHILKAACDELVREILRSMNYQPKRRHRFQILRGYQQHMRRAQ